MVSDDRIFLLQQFDQRVGVEQRSIYALLEGPGRIGGLKKGMVV